MPSISQRAKAFARRLAAAHTTRIAAPGQVQCIVLTRVSTTLDLQAHLTSGSPLTETTIVNVTPSITLEMDAR